MASHSLDLDSSTRNHRSSFSCSSTLFLLGAARALGWFSIRLEYYLKDVIDETTRALPPAHFYLRGVARCRCIILPAVRLAEKAVQGSSQILVS